ncbi:hypothetical protein BFP97_04015 [Roseivirga sp. 4D4]|uniref:AraC family transcriptional regulator n=1 Tax=Roseivirga sp. 4D4 TaxID=1889784 RepID=UPI0008535587|nr:AraC family transcriptional regulator [Roseivirga sp. 4D4]OEK00724.1 hypothetical protein BFP97_04015 [Roseivirga sp. 4D4]
MRLTEFPDIQWLRKQANNNFQNGRDVNNQPITQQGWPSVVLNTTSFGAERNGIKGPFSIFLNLSGKSLVKVGGKTVELTNDNLCMVNSGEFYDLIIPEGSGTDTFNVHFGERLFNEVLSYSNRSTDQLLDDPMRSCEANCTSKIHSTWKSGLIHEKVLALSQFYQVHNGEKDLEYELMADLLSTVLRDKEYEHSYDDALGATKNSTKQELSTRVGMSVDYMHAHFRETVTLDELSAIACMSKYHYLRTFKSIYRCTPQQMIAELRLKKASQLLIENDQPISEIAPSLGFSELAAFTRFFTKRMGLSPKAFRLSN